MTAHDPHDATIPFIRWLCADKLVGLGQYDVRTCNRLRRARTRARRELLDKVARLGVACLAWHTITDRFTSSWIDGAWDFHFAPQSDRNTELTNVIRRLVDPDATWLE